MYKVFVNDKPIILSNEVTSDLDYEFCYFNEVGIEEILHKLRHTKAVGYYVYHKDLDFLWNKFQSCFEVIEAAGGLVIRDEKLLLIYRNELWDLPKGKGEKGESMEQTALREVAEECSVFNLIIEKHLQNTYHIFFEDNMNKLKITHWFTMSTTFVGDPVPQKEEGISVAKFITIENIADLYPKMYANINDLLKEYFKTYHK